MKNWKRKDSIRKKRLWRRCRAACSDGWGYVTHHSKAWKQEYERYCRLRELPMNDGTAWKFLQMKQEELEEAIANGDA